MVTTRNSAAYTLPALDSFFRRTELKPDDRFFLIDNDGDFAVPERFARVEVIRPARPRSFAANVNDVLRRAGEARTDLAFLNNDIIFTPDWWPPLTVRDDALTLPTCNQNFQYAIEDFALRASLTLDDYDGRERHLLAAVDFHRGRMLPGALFDELRVNFYCFRLPPAVYDRVGLFDEAYGPGGAEDCDYNLRVRLAGFPVLFVGASYVLHFVGKSTWQNETPEQLRARHEKYMKRFREKWGDDLAALFVVDETLDAALERLGMGGLYAARDYRAMITDCLIRRNA